MAALISQTLKMVIRFLVFAKTVGWGRFVGCLLIGLLFNAFLLAAPFQGATAADSLPETEEGSVNTDKIDDFNLQDVLRSDFAYVRENRSDPFLPFITEKTISRQAEEVEEDLCCMQLFEPGQLSLVGIVLSDSKSVALVQDSSGLGHYLRKNDKVGRRGVVTDILQNMVVIKEWSLTTTGKKKFKNIEIFSSEILIFSARNWLRTKMVKLLHAWMRFYYYIQDYCVPENLGKLLIAVAKKEE